MNYLTNIKYVRCEKERSNPEQSYVTNNQASPLTACYFTSDPNLLQTLIMTLFATFELYNEAVK